MNRCGVPVHEQMSLCHSALRSVRFACVLLVVGLTGADAYGQPLLRWNLKPGKAYDVERIATQKQTVEIQGKATTEERKSVWRVRLQSLEQRGDEFIVRATLTAVQHFVAGVAKEELLDARLHERLQGARFTLRVAPDGRIVEFSGYDDFLMRFAGGMKQATKTVRMAYPEETLRDGFADIFGPLPEKAVKPGDSWERMFVEPIPHFGSLHAKVKYTYAKDSADAARIMTTVTTKYEPPKNESAVVFRVVHGRITSEKGEGSLEFHRKAGHLAKHDRHWTLAGELVVEAANQRQTVTIQSESNIRVTIAAVTK